MTDKKPANQNNKSKKRKKKKSKHKGDKHFCWVCGEHKAHEKFSGRGHANHMCKQCHALPVAERNIMVATRRAENMAFRYLNEQEIKWLRKKMNDPRPEVRDAAREAHRIKFPRHERNILKKGLTARSLEFYINGEVWDEWGDEVHVHMRFFVDSSGILRCIDYDKSEIGRETAINIGQSSALKFLKAVVHQLNAPFWSEDLSDAEPDDCGFQGYAILGHEDDENFDWAVYIDGINEDESSNGDDNISNNTHDEDNEQDNNSEQGTSAEKKEPIWSLHLLLNKGIGEITQTFYNQMHENPQNLFWSLMEWFEVGNDEFESDDI